MTPGSVLGAKTIERVETAPSVPQGRSTPGVGHCALGGDECSGDTGEGRGAERPCLRTVEGTKALWSGVASHLIIHLYSPLWALVCSPSIAV